ncbi:MAG: ribonucleoside-diphosphate reductase, adenosylcobalamin-dependent [Deltaproteobacteria bacterium GWC2_42_11]|nr:MAG: ribonucleoside-diphosphate reductase, adenosylcobalamin-dependent [Deltaproteobacteria bacterium GWC2_42_11]
MVTEKYSTSGHKYEHGAYPRLSENAVKVLEKRYLKKDVNGKPMETPDDMFKRVAGNIAKADLNYNKKAEIKITADEFYNIIASLEFLPNSPTLMNAGRELQQLSACFVLPVDDSMDSIFEAVKHTALIHKSGGGTGFSFSRLRPSGDMVGSTSGISSGPISFMTVFDSATEAIKQGGTRRGANMGILRVDHPDILSFIRCKEDNSKLNNFNISAAITERFMEAALKGEEYELINPRDKKVDGRLNARDVFNKIVAMAWKNGDPGIVFIDRINRDNPTPHVGEIESTNPCGEQPLLSYESCNLGSVNLAKMVKDKGHPEKRGQGYEIDWERLEYITKKAVHFLDNVIDMNKYPIPQIEKMTRGNRKIGLGVMGFADMLIRLGIPYNSQDALDTAEEVMSFIQAKGRDASRKLAEQRGVFPNYNGSIYDTGGKVRNATVTTIAPTGTISIIAGCSSGIEPIFALAFTRNVLDGAELVDVNPLFEEVANERGFFSYELMKKVAATGSLHDIEDIPDGIKDIFVTAHDITPEWHIKMQAAFQKYTDNAVSKTVNFPNEATVEDVAKVYQLAYRLNCKGVTVYRDESREVQVLNKGQKQQSIVSTPIADTRPLTTVLTPKPRGEITFGATRKMKTGCGNLYVTINEDEEGKPFEIFTQIGKAGGCAASQCEAIGRLASLALRSGIQPDEVVKQMRGISCHIPVGYGNGKIQSCSDAVAKAMDWYINYKKQVQGKTWIKGQYPAAAIQSSDVDVFARGACPDCGAQMQYEEGCAKCICGYSDCG